MSVVAESRSARSMPRARFLHVRQRVCWRLARYARRVHGRGPLLVAVGDSLTDPTSGYTFPRQVWLRVVARKGYKTFNLGVSGETTGEMRRRIEQTLGEGQPQIAVVFGGANDAFRGIDPSETERNVTFMVNWLGERGVHKIALIGPGLPNWERDAEWTGELEVLGTLLRDIADRHGAIFVDLAGFLRDRIVHGEDSDSSRVPDRTSRSWYVQAGDPHFNAYGQRLIAQAFLAATTDWRRAP